MKKTITILLLAYYSLGTICLPLGDFSKISELKNMYQNCEKEDPDINTADFVFEHLLNFGSVIQHFEHHNKNEKEIPHQPWHFHINLIQPACNITQLPRIDFEKKEIGIKDFNPHNKLLFPYGYCNTIFRPPTVVA